MELDAPVAGQAVRCVHCGGLVRTPVVAPMPDEPGVPPLAALAAAASVVPPLPPVLSYVPAWPWRHARELHFAEMARRLHELDSTGGDRPEAAEDTDAMTNCSYCGSTIAGFLRKCPYCRHALWGV
jgi:hypothetical protein